MRRSPPQGTQRPERLVDLLNDSTAAVYRAATVPEWSVVSGAGGEAVEALERLKGLLTETDAHYYPPKFRERLDDALYAVRYISPRYAKNAIDELVAEFNRYWNTG